MHISSTYAINDEPENRPSIMMEKPSNNLDIKHTSQSCRCMFCIKHAKIQAHVSMYVKDKHSKGKQVCIDFNFLQHAREKI